LQELAKISKQNAQISSVAEVRDDCLEMVAIVNEVLS
jgi:hypothetical protein